MTNAIDVVAQTRNPAIFKEVRSVSSGSGGLPDPILAPDGVMRVPIELGVKYVAHELFVWPKLLWPDTPSTDIVFTEIAAISQNVAMLVDGDDIPHIWGRGTGNIRLNNILILDVSNGGAGFGSTLFDLVGQSTDIDPIQRQNALFVNDTAIIGFADTGRVVDIGVALLGSGWGVERGLVVRSASGNVRQIASPFSQASLGVSMKTPMLTYQGAQTVASLSGGSLGLAPGDSSFAIDSAAAGTYDFLGITYGGPAFGNFFRPDISNPITAFADVDIAFTSVSDSTEKPGVDSTINFSGIQKFVRGQKVFLKGDTGTTYDGPRTIVRVSADESSFDINVAFGAPDSGNVKITRVTSVAHGLVVGETQTRTGTTNYNQTDEVLFRVDDDNFDIPQPFNGNDATGTVSSASKNEESSGVNTLACGEQPDSKSVSGPLVAVAGNIPSFNGITGRLVQDSGLGVTTVTDHIANTSIHFVIGTTAGTAAEGNDSRIPTQGENDALVGTDGTPATANPYVTDSDSRNTDARTPSGAAGGGLSGTYPNPAVDPAGHAHTHASTTGQTADDHHAEDHAARHQNGGADELNVGGLSGTLADPQTPAAHTHTHASTTGQTADDHHSQVHDLAGADHNSATLAALNAKVSDATLDDSSASRTPTGSAGGDLGGTYPNPTVTDGVTNAGTSVDDNLCSFDGGTGEIIQDSGIATATVTGHIADLTLHRTINDAGFTTTDLWSASKIDAVTSAIADGIDIKPGVATSTAGLGNITLSGEQTLNGFLTSASRVVVTEQTLMADNGVYVSAAGAWARAPDSDTDSEVTNGNTVHVLNTGSTKNNYKYILVTPDPIVVGTTGQTWDEFTPVVFGTTAATTCEGNDPRLATQDENDALQGTSGAPSSTNRYVTNADSRNTDSRTPSGAATGGLGGTYPAPSVNGMTAGVLTDDAAHGVRGGGTQHADVVASGADGFMTGADKTKLDGIEDLADVTDAGNVAAAGGILSGDAAGGGLSGTYPSPGVNGMAAGVLANDAAHGVRGGATQHAVATPSVAGFESAADKTKLNALLVSEFTTTGVLFDGTNPTRFIHTSGAGVFQTPTGATVTIPAAAPTGTYEVSLDFEWGYNTATSHFFSQLLQSGVGVPIMEHAEEPADSVGSGGVVDGADMVMVQGRKRTISFTTGVAVTFTFQFAPEAAADCAVRRVSLSVRRVS